jgi:hypothetical protein
VGRRRIASGVAGVEKSRVGGSIAGVGNSCGGVMRGVVQRRAVKDGTTDVGRSRVGAA